MNASPSSSPLSSSARTTSEAAPNPRHNLTLVRPTLSCGGAFVVGALLIHLLPAPSLTDAVDAGLPPVHKLPLQLSASQIVTARGVSLGARGRTLSGRWKLTTDVLGRAPVSGEVARWVVEPGARVETGDRVIEISTGVASRSAPVVETQQNRAEREQVAAADGQTALAQKLAVAQTQLAAAQERVASAQAKVAATRSLVKRLLAGEKIPVAGNAAPIRKPRVATPEPIIRRTNPAVSQAKERASAAKAELDDANKALAKAQKQGATTALALSKAETDFKDEKTTADVLQNARADADDAAVALKAAQTRADIAGRAFQLQQEKVTTTENSAAPAVNTPQPSKAEQPVADANNEDAGRYLTADAAATLAEAALRESKAATRQAERIHSRVDDYQRQVGQTSQRVESASKDLQKAQQSVLDSVPRALFTSVRAPTTGTVTWISRLAREVGAGQTVFGMSQGRSEFLQFEDKSEAWKTLEVGQTLNAAAKSSSAQSDESPTSNDSPAMPSSSQTAASSSGAVASAVSLAPAPTFSVRITHITPPSGEGEPARIDAVRTDGSNVAAADIEEVQAELPLNALPVNQTLSSDSRPVVVPLSVVLARDGATYVAVIEPQLKQANPFQLHWRAVQVRRGSAFDIEIKSGLHEGERVVDQPVLLLSQSKPEEKTLLPVTVQSD